MSLRGVLLACVAAVSFLVTPANAKACIQHLNNQPQAQLAGKVTSFGSAPTLSSVTLAWNPSPGSSVAGYILYEGLASQNYTNTFDVGNATNATISQLVPGTTYYFAVAAYDSNNVQSLLSPEVSYLVPNNGGSGATLQVAMSANQALLSGNAPAGYSYNVQASQDLKTWRNIGSVTADSNGSLQFTDTNAPGPLNFYRLLQTSP
jgi:hypothetical protein